MHDISKEPSVLSCQMARPPAGQDSGPCNVDRLAGAGWEEAGSLGGPTKEMPGVRLTSPLVITTPSKEDPRSPWTEILPLEDGPPADPNTASSSARPVSCLAAANVTSRTDSSVTMHDLLITKGTLHSTYRI